MRFLHTADWHLGKVLHETSLLSDQAFVLEQLLQEVTENSYDVLVIAGDIFDRSVPPPEAVGLWDDILVRLRSACPSLTLLVIPGNHDSAARLAYASRFLSHERIHIRTNRDDLAQPIRVGAGPEAVDFYAVPWLSGSSQSELWTQALAQLHDARHPQIPSVLVAHLFTVGGTESEAERVFVGEGEQIPASWLSGWSYVALGHLHHQQEPGPHIWYSGSPLAYSFSEAGSEVLERPKSWLRVEITSEGCTVTPLAIRAAHPMTRLRGRYDEFLTDPRWSAFEEHYLELTLTDPALVSQPMDRLRLRFPYLLSLQQEARSPEGRSTDLPQAEVAAGSLAQDALLFLSDVLPESSPASRELISNLAREVLHEAP